MSGFVSALLIAIRNCFKHSSRDSFGIQNEILAKNARNVDVDVCALDNLWSREQLTVSTNSNYLYDIINLTKLIWMSFWHSKSLYGCSQRYKE